MNNLLKPAVETNILVVDDTPDNLRLLAKILESHNYTVRKSLSGKMALQAVYRDPPDLILLDINMPEINGYEVCKILKESEATRSIPIIFISALDQITDKVRAFEIGGQDYITKPFQELEVLARVRNQLLIQQHQHQLEQEIQERKKAEAEIRHLNADLERRVQARTLELHQSLKFETTLKCISDKVRDSLDPHQVLQNAVEELAKALEVPCCHAVLYNSEHPSSFKHYQYVASGGDAVQSHLLCLPDVPKIYHQLQDQQSYSAFCQTQFTPLCGQSAILSCPIFDEQVNQVGILGDLWLFKGSDATFSELEIHLVQQVTNQCAIALRQARLYEEAQAQVKALERLNQLKDDFLSTISHELRTPIASMKMVIKLLTTVTNQGRTLVEEISKSSNQNNKVVQYLEVLREECDRELALVEDLLHLQHAEAGTYNSQTTTINLYDLLAHLIEPFEIRTHNQQQILQVNLAPGLPSLTLDLLAINRIVTELLSNACKYTPPGGTIAISASMTQPSHETHFTPALQITVANTGVEIATEELSRIFDKFYRIPNNDPWKHGGTGLGLALIKKLVEQMDGTIRVESRDNQTSFTVLLAISADQLSASPFHLSNCMANSHLNRF
ncbi:MAG: response regulator [Oculatellaceae cyanobacterium bins.114]|nr:response regulator [Oculatellaceae cyanobacterium bins.114]